jgi:hypothetical protein
VQRPAPLLSMEAYEDEETPLGQLVEAAGRDEGTVWHRVSACSGCLVAALAPHCTLPGVRVLPWGDGLAPCPVDIGSSTAPADWSRAITQTHLQVYGLGDKAELLVAVRQPEGPNGATAITLTSDLATPAVVHWGVKRRGKRGEWLRAPSEVRMLCWHCGMTYAAHLQP